MSNCQWHKRCNREDNAEGNSGETHLLSPFLDRMCPPDTLMVPGHC